MLDPETWTDADFPGLETPVLAVVVDTEEEFDWSRPLARENTGVGSIRHQARAHEIFGQYGIRPTYVVDYAVAIQPDGYGPLGELVADGLCDIGAHLHPWVNPPFEEEVCNRNSYPGNLAETLEKEKLRRLTAEIEDRFGIRPRVYRAGRYGVGPATSGILAGLGYEVDSSVVPFTDFRRGEGPDFTACGCKPYWFGRRERRLLEIPVTVGFAGFLGAGGRNLYTMAAGPLGLKLRLPGLLARSGMVERIRLTPEGADHEERCRLVKALLRTGHRVFTFNYHSPSLGIGHTPYVRSRADLDAFLDGLSRFFDFFLDEIGGRTATLAEMRAMAGPDAP